MPKLGLKKEVKNNQITITPIHYKNLVRGKYQYCDATDEYIKEFAESILIAQGIKQNLVVKQVETDKYEIIAGHKRAAAAKYIDQVLGIKGYELLPCSIENLSDARTEMSTYVTNDYYEPTLEQTIIKIKGMKELLEKYPDAFPDFPTKGSMTSRIAKRLGMRETSVKETLAISNNISPKGMEAIAKGELTQSTAYELSKLDKKEQDKQLEQGDVTVASLRAVQKEKKEVTTSPTSDYLEKENNLDATKQLPGQLTIIDENMETAEIDLCNEIEKNNMDADSMSSYKTIGKIITQMKQIDTYIDHVISNDNDTKMSADDYVMLDVVSKKLENVLHVLDRISS